MGNKTELSLKEKHEIILEIMKDIDLFCRNNDIPYSISSGTLLGAVRHGGFIPWDDDADMFMLREDFERFKSIYKSDRFNLICQNKTGNDFFGLGFIKIKDPSTFVSNADGMANEGLFVDIFPLDGVPEDPTLRKKYMHKVMRIHNRIYHRLKKDFISIIKSYRHSLRWWINRLNTLLHDSEYKDSRLVAHIVGTTNFRTVIDRNRFKTLENIKFEGYDFLGFKDTDSYLSMVYGDDYMVPKQWSHNLKVYRKEEEK